MGRTDKVKAMCAHPVPCRSVLCLLYVLYCVVLCLIFFFLRPGPAHVPWAMPKKKIQINFLIIYLFFKSTCQVVGVFFSSLCTFF